MDDVEISKATLKINNNDSVMSEKKLLDQKKVKVGINDCVVVSNPIDID